ncbi:hypothetical protein MMC26_007232 [Xylographa opegraphella]|nr:hypothetical protein [Xylographa opegraphella]
MHIIPHLTVATSILLSLVHCHRIQAQLYARDIVDEPSIWARNVNKPHFERSSDKSSYWERENDDPRLIERDTNTYKVSKRDIEYFVTRVLTRRDVHSRSLPLGLRKRTGHGSSQLVSDKLFSSHAMVIEMYEEDSLIYGENGKTIIGTGGLSGCIAVVVVSPTAAVVGHIPPNESADKSETESETKSETKSGTGSETKSGTGSETKSETGSEITFIDQVNKIKSLIDARRTHMSGARAFVVYPEYPSGNSGVSDEVEQLMTALKDKHLQPTRKPYTPGNHGGDAGTVVVDHGTLYIEGHRV